MPYRQLTHRENEIYKLLLIDKYPPSSKAIARKLGISHRTVERHRSRILEKMGVETTAELATVARRADISEEVV